MAGIRTKLHDLVERDRLVAAWEHVDASDRNDGSRAPSMVSFGGRLDAELDTLHAELLAGTYRPRPVEPCHDPQAQWQSARAPDSGSTRSPWWNEHYWTACERTSTAISPRPRSAIDPALACSTLSADSSS